MSLSGFNDSQAAPARRVPTLPARLGWAALCVLAALLVAWPMMQSGFAGDDWLFVAVGRHLENPIDLFRHDHSLSYFYRPIAMSVWWLSVAAFGADPQPQYLLNLLLHAGNAWLVAHLARQLDARGPWPLLAALCFVVHPATIGPAMWLSDRFDLLATGFVLLALSSCISACRGAASRGPTLLFAFLAAGSKESAIVLLPMLAVLLVLAPGRDRSWRAQFLALVVVAMAPLFAARLFVVHRVDAALGAGNPFETIAHGSLAWLRQFPQAIFGGGTGWPAVRIGLCIALILAFAWVLRQATIRNRAPLAAIAIALLALGLVQSPVTAGALSATGALENPANSRFYYLAIALLLVPLSCAAAACTDGRPVMLPFVLAIALLVPLGFAAQRSHAIALALEGQARAWHAIAREATRHAGSRQAAGPCTIWLLGTAQDRPYFQGFADVAIKALLPRGHPALDCVALTESGPHYALTRAGPAGECRDSDHPEWVPRGAETGPLRASRLGNLCIRFPRALDHGARETTTPSMQLRWDVARQQFVDETPRSGG